MTAVCEWCGALEAEDTCPWSLTCPDCDARPGARCKRPSGHEADVLHMARVRLAEGDSAPATRVRDDAQMTLTIERIAEPLPGGRAQLVERVFEDGDQVPELTVVRGSPAAADVVRRHQETLTMTATTVTRSAP